MSLILSVRNLTKKIGDSIVLSGVNIDVASGEIIAVIGPSGSGKSTLLRAINQLDPPTSGEVYYKDTLITAKNIDVMRQNIGMVFENFGLFSHMTVLENIMAAQVDVLKKSKTDATVKALELLKTVGLLDYADYYPRQLSGGQKQRIAIARCLAIEPEVILFDEPTSALDPTMVGEVMAVLRLLAKMGMTMLIVTHEMAIARNVATRVLYMDEHGVYEDAAPDAIFSEPQRAKTQRFVFKIHFFEYDIVCENFDFAEMLGQIEHFCVKHATPPKTAHKLVLVAEEIVINMIVPEFKTCHLTIGYSEKQSRYEMTIRYFGSDDDVVSTSKDTLAQKIVMHEAETISHTFDAGENILKLAF